jgi:hypothetical protein
MVAHSLIASDRVEGTPRGAGRHRHQDRGDPTADDQQAERFSVVSGTTHAPNEFERLAALAPFRCEAQWVGTRSFICELK